MTQAPVWTPNPELDLVLEREVDVPRSLVWKVWTEPEHLRHWFCPRPWMVTECQIDLRPGGVFSTVMRGPDGQEFPNVGCILEVVPEERLVTTDALLPGFRPAENPFFTCVLLLESRGAGTLYKAIGLHRDPAGRQKHEEMGFHQGWGTALDQLVAYVKAM